jgi:hypothetical protein
MRTNWGSVPLNSVLPFFFDSYDGATGASETLSGLAVTDIEVYKGTSMTQRSSDAGYTLLDTDGIDLDGITGINGFSIDTSDNTDAGFFAAGSFYTVVVSAVTIDTQTVNFVAGTFRLVAAEGTAGTPVADVTRMNNVAATAITTIKAVQGLATDGVIPTVTTVTNQLTAAQIATGVWQDATAGDFTAASSIGKSLYTAGVVPGGTNGLFIAGTNAATTITTSLTTTFTGNLTGSVASVTATVNADVDKINGTTVLGTGVTGDLWRG